MKKGFLIAFEGPDGSGKSTQFKILKHWLETLNYPVVETKWKSSPELSPLIKSRKESKSLTPNEYSLLHAADFLLRLENIILPALKNGKIVLCDRYVFTALARDSVRGLDKVWIWNLYQPVVYPDMVFYFSISAETALQRIRACREPKYYEAGQDVTQIADPMESFKTFMKRVIDTYEAMANEHHFLRIDATQPVHVQQKYIRSVFEQKYKASLAKTTVRHIVRPFSQVRVPRRRSVTYGVGS